MHFAKTVLELFDWHEFDDDEHVTYFAPYLPLMIPSRAVWGKNEAAV